MALAFLHITEMVETVSGYNAPPPTDPTLISSRLSAPRKPSRVSAATVTELPPAVVTTVGVRLGLKAPAAASVAGAAAVKKTMVYSHDLLSVVLSGRAQCKLPYLNGAALVVWGLPVRFELAVAAK